MSSRTTLPGCQNSALSRYTHQCKMCSLCLCLHCAHTTGQWGSAGSQTRQKQAIEKTETVYLCLAPWMGHQRLANSSSGAGEAARQGGSTETPFSCLDLGHPLPIQGTSVVCLYCRHIMPFKAITTEPEAKNTILITVGHHQVPQVTPEFMVIKVSELELLKHLSFFWRISALF